MTLLKKANRHTLVVLFVVLLLIPYNSVTAASYLIVDTTLHPRKPYKITEQQFIATYGTDDSARALIRYYFPKRKTNILLTIYGGGSLVVFSALGGLVLLTTTGNLLTFLILITLLAGGYVAALILVIGLALLLSYSRRRLYKMLQSYKNGNGIPKHIRRKSSYQWLVKREHRS